LRLLVRTHTLPASRQPEAVKTFLVQMLDGVREDLRDYEKGVLPSPVSAAQVLHKMCEAMMKDERGEPKRFLVGDRLTVADTYAYIVLGCALPT